MNLIVVGSGSDGNCYLVEDENGYLMLDCGCTLPSVKNVCGFQTSRINAALITHRHGDHAGKIEDFMRAGIKCYSNELTANDIVETTSKKLWKLPDKKWTSIYGNYRIFPFNVPHEDVPNSAYLIEFPDGERLLYATDFELIKYRLDKAKINHFLIAVNRSEDVEKNDVAYDHRYRGHSSLETVKEFLKASMSDKTRSVIACHLSKQYADADKIERELSEICGDKVNVFIAEKGMKIEL